MGTSVTRTRLAHVHAHARAPALLQPPALLYVHARRHLLAQVVLVRLLDGHRTDHPREDDLADGRLAEHLVAARGHERSHDPQRDVALPVRVAASHLKEAQRDERVVGDVRGGERRVDGHRDLTHEPRHEREVERGVRVRHLRGGGSPVRGELRGREIEEGVRLRVRFGGGGGRGGGGGGGGRARDDGATTTSRRAVNIDDDGVVVVAATARPRRARDEARGGARRGRRRRRARRRRRRGGGPRRGEGARARHGGRTDARRRE
eukprot:31439-Pelagococcus_subviridis.AAC.33